MPRGGKRDGAGRKKGTSEPVKRVERALALKVVDKEIRIVRESAAGKAVTAAVILASVDEGGLWAKLLDASGTAVTKEGSIEYPDWRVRLEALKYLTDRRDGKAKQISDVTLNDKRADPAKRIAELLDRRLEADSGNAKPRGAVRTC